MRVTCRACEAVKQRDLEELIIDRRFRRLSMEWEAVRRTMPCRNRDSVDTRVDSVPFGQDDRERRARRSQALLMNPALSVLDEASRRARDEDVCVPATRLALRVLRPYLPDRELLATFWTAAETGRGKPRGPALQAMRSIVTKLVSTPGIRSGRSFGEVIVKQPSKLHAADLFRNSGRCRLALISTLVKIRLYARAYPSRGWLGSYLAMTPSLHLSAP
jgi:hypothetical protein